MPVKHYIIVHYGGLEHYWVKSFGTIVWNILGNVPITNFQLQRLKETLVLKWVELGAHKHESSLIFDQIQSGVALLSSSAPAVVLSLVRLRQPKKPRFIFLYLGHARAHDNTISSYVPTNFSSNGWKEPIVY